MSPRHDGDLAPTPRLRFVRRVPDEEVAHGDRLILHDTPRGDALVPRLILQQWWAPNVPTYMQSEGVGEWRDVVVVEGAP